MTNLFFSFDGNNTTGDINETRKDELNIVGTSYNNNKKQLESETDIKIYFSKNID